MGHNIPLIWEYVAHVIFDISSVNNSDFVRICGNYVAWLRGERDASEELRSRGYSQEHIERAKLFSRKTNDFIIDNVKFTKPLSGFKYPLMGYLLVLFENYERGVLPFPGTISEQPAQAIEMFSLLQNLKLMHQVELEKKRLNDVKRSRKR